MDIESENNVIPKPKDDLENTGEVPGSTNASIGGAQLDSMNVMPVSRSDTPADSTRAPKIKSGCQIVPEIPLDTFNVRPKSFNDSILSPDNVGEFYLDTYASSFDNESTIDYYMAEKDACEYEAETFENSIIPEVAATIPTFDQNLPALTLRVFIITTILIITTSLIGQYYWFKINDLTLDSNCHVILSYVLGKLLENIPLKVLNSTPFNYKEHTMIMIACSAAVTRPYANLVLIIQRIYMGSNQDVNVINQSGVDIGSLSAIAFIISTELIGVGLGGLFEKILVHPAKMWWPSTLVLSNLIHTFHGSLTKNITRLRTKMFFVVLILGLVYQLLPQIFMPILQCVSLICLFAGGASQTVENPINPRLSQFGSIRGGGIGSLTFDWSAMVSTDPMVTPLWSQLNYLGSNYLFSWILTPILFFSNFWNAGNIPAYSTGTFNEDGSTYNISLVLDSHGLVPIGSNPPPLKLSVNRLLVYGAAFAALSSVLSQFVVFYLSDFKGLFDEGGNKDIHTRMMKVYPKVPIWIYSLILACSAALGMTIINLHNDAFQLPIWGIPLAILICAIFIVPVGMLTAISNQTIGLNVASEFLMGYLNPGSLLSNTTFKVFTTNTLASALDYSRNVKMGYYMKLSTPYVLAAQIYGHCLASISFILLSSIVQHF